MSAAAASSSNGAADEVDQPDEQKNLSKEQAAESKQLDAVTDFAEDAEMDAEKAEAALNKLTSSAETEEQQKLARELAAVVVKNDDIELLAKEFEISTEEAEKRIRVARGDVKLAITNAIAA